MTPKDPLDNTSFSVNSTRPPSSQGQFKKILLVSLAALISLLIICIAIMPALVSSKWGNEKLITIVNRQIPGSLSAEKISLNWFGPQELHGVLLSDAEGDPILSLKQGIYQTSLFRLLFNNPPLSGLTIDSLNGKLSTDAQGNTNIEKALNKNCCQIKTAEKEKFVTILFKNINAFINSSDNKHLAAHFTGETLQNTQSGKFVIDAQLKDFAFNQLLQESLEDTGGQSEFKVNAEIVNLPVALLDQFVALKYPELAGLLQEILGQQLNLTLSQIADQSGVKLNLNAQSTQLAATAELSINDQITLKTPAMLQFKITPQLLARLASTQKIDLPWQFKSSAAAELMIDTLQYPTPLLENVSFEDLNLIPLALKANLKLQPVSLISNNGMTIDIQQLTAKLETEANKQAGLLSVRGDAKYLNSPFAINLNVNFLKPSKLRNFNNNLFQSFVDIHGGVQDLPIASFASQLGLSDQLAQVAGNTADMNISLQLENQRPIAVISIKSDVINIPDLSFSVGKDIALNKPANAAIHISPKMIESIFSGNSNAFQLKNTASAQIQINQLSFPKDKTSSFFPDTVAIKANVSFSPVEISQLPIGDVSLNDLNLHINGDSLSNAACHASGIFSQTEKQGLLYDLLGDKTRINVSTNLCLSKDQNAFANSIDVKIAGDLAEMNMNVSIRDNDKYDINAGLQSQLFAGSASFSIDRISNNVQPAHFDLILTTKGYAALRQQLGGMSDFTLTEPARMTFNLQSLNIPQKTSAFQPFWKMAINADFAIDKLVGIDTKTQGAIALNDIQGHIFGEDISQQASFELYAKGEANTNPETSLSINGSLEKGFSPTGSINKNDLSLNLDASLVNLPIPMLCQLACLDSKMSQKLNALIGANLDAKIKAQLQHMNGPIFIEMKGTNGHTVLDGQLFNGNLTLNNNFYAELTITPQLGKYVLQDLIPFLSGMLGSDQPLKLAIAKENFFLPLRQPAIENISIGAATFELGKVRFSNEGQLAKVLSLLTTASANEIMVWLTPTYFSFNNGIFSLQRVDMLISDRYPIAAWGQVNIPGDNVNMMIGLSGAAISKAFSVPNIKKSYMLQLPLRGTMKNTSIDKSKAIARLSALVAQSQGGAEGLVLGTVLDIATGGFEEKPPHSTTQPLPWEAMMEEKNDAKLPAPIEDITKIIPIEEIGKTTGNLLKKLFKRN